MDSNDGASERLEGLLRRARLDFSGPLPHDMANPHEDDERDCRDDECAFCVHGVEMCSMCGGMELTLTTHCPGEWIGLRTLFEVQRGRIDYSGKLWVEL
ncbi:MULTISPECIES: hypothetical protein [Streptomyces]|uniref:hypothetical protein n=1 Tax=Streptomyces TaxID=1883 RepID=UPI003661C92E